MKGVQCYELFGGIALKIHTFSLLLGHATMYYVFWYVFVDSFQLHQLPNVYLSLFCQELANLLLLLLCTQGSVFGPSLFTMYIKPLSFDTIDHPILVHRLHTDIGFTDTVLQCFSSYLTDRTHYVSLSNHCSAFAPVHSGVPQGSVLGPILFTMYNKPLSTIIGSHSIIHHSFADDLQPQMSAPLDGTSELLHSMQSCISDVKAWATANMLRLNDDKTELMLVISKRNKHLHSLPTSITFGNAQISFSL